MALTLGLAVLSFGGVHAPARAVLHGMLAVGLVIAVAQPVETLERAGRVEALGRWLAIALGVMGLGLVPLPSVLMEWVQPGTAAAAPDRLHPLTWTVPATVGALTTWGLVAGAVVTTGIWAAWQPRRSTVERAATAATVVVVITAIGHAAGGLTSLYGIVETWVQPPDRFFAPFLNDNHLASILLLTWPLWLDRLCDPRSSGAQRAVALVLAVAQAGLFVATGSLGASVVAVGLLLTVGIARGVVPVAVGGMGAIGGIAALVAFDPLSEHGRTTLWRAALALWADHPVFGSGVGTFGQAVDAYRTDLAYVTWDHAHNDWLEWAVETGLVGVAVLVAGVVWVVRQPAPRSASRARWLQLGVVGVAAHATVEFPLHVPGIAMTTAALFTVLHVLHRDRQPSDPGRVRQWLLVLAAGQIAFGAWQVRTAFEQFAVRTVLTRAPDGAAAVKRLETVAPWRPEIGLYRAWGFESANRGAQALAEARAVVAAHPVDTTAQRLAAQVLVRQGAVDEARAVIERSVHRDPTDWRQWTARAVIIEAHAPDQRAEAWLEAVRRGAPARYLRRAWKDLPEGLAWVDAVADRPPRWSRSMGHALADLDPEAAVVAFDQARVDDGYVDPAQVRLLVRLGRFSEAELVLAEADPARTGEGALLRLTAELRERQERHAEAAEAWLRLSDREPSAQLRAIQATERAKGSEAALALVETLSLERGVRGLHPGSRLEHARLLFELGQTEACVVQIRRGGLLTHERYEGTARRLLRQCRQAQR